MKSISKILIALALFTGLTTANAQSNWKAPATAKTIKSPLTGSANDLKAGKKIFTEMCVICHGIKGKGDGIAAAALSPKPANYTSKTVQDQTDGELFWKITNGNAPTAAMAAYKDILTETQRWQMVAYIRTFKK
jgi:mono/diheme cytochrome c family protein